MNALHTWSGVVLGSLLFVIFWMGTLSVFDREIDRWMMPATRLASPSAQLPIKLDGTVTDRAALAWGKVLEAMSSVGAYSDVVFDDPAIHAAIEDCGGWVKIW